MIIHVNAILDVNNVYLNHCVQLLGAQRLFDVIKVSVDRVSTIYSLTHSAINWRDCHIILK